MAGLTGAESVEAFLYFRTPVVDQLTSLSEGGRMAATAMLRVSSAVNSFLDQVLLATVNEHEEQARLTAGAAIQTSVDGQILNDA